MPINGGHGFGSFCVPIVSPCVTFRHDDGSAIIFVEVINRPYGCGAQWLTGAGQAIEGVIVMQPLWSLAGKNVDNLALGQQKTGLEQPIHEPQNSRMNSELVGCSGLGQNVVDPLRLVALERVSSGLAEQRKAFFLDRSAGFKGDQFSMMT